MVVPFLHSQLDPFCRRVPRLIWGVRGVLAKAAAVVAAKRRSAGPASANKGRICPRWQAHTFIQMRAYLKKIFRI
jgi:hypothetical protein